MECYDSYVSSFKEYLLSELNYTVKTSITYTRILNNFGKYIKNNNLNFKNISIDNAQKYKAYLITKLDNKTTSLILSTLRTFYNYLIEIKVISFNPFVNLKNPKLVKKLPNFLKPSETKNFIDEEGEDNLDIRNKFIIEFLYTTGIRVSELVNIKLSDINFREGKVRILGKGNKERIVYFKACSKSLIDAYLNVRESIGKNLSEYLIIGTSGNKLTTRSIELIVKKYALKNNLKSKVTPHTLRHTFATDLLNNGADIRSVGELLGHESLSTTQIYTHVTNERLKAIYNKTHPRK